MVLLVDEASGVAVTEREIKILLVELDGGEAKASLASTAHIVVTSAASYDHARRVLGTTEVDVIIVSCGGRAATEVAPLEAFLDAVPQPPVLAVFPSLAERVAVRLIKRGIRGLLLSQDVRFLATSVGELLRGGTPMSPPVSRLVMQRARRSSSRLAAVKLPTPRAGTPADKPGRDEARDAPQLSQRQREILGFLQRGYSYDDIGTALDLSVNTVRSHVRAIYERLGAASKVEAVMAGLKLGLL
ncbi:MAG TPA: LuxR C-terminal-related transcriptional regulator [Polyangiaceae bacterium]|nr:LuxR C-terminal-related transcriptional regulator [Polyangiaceae bacterium]